MILTGKSKEDKTLQETLGSSASPPESGSKSSASRKRLILQESATVKLRGDSISNSQKGSRRVLAEHSGKPLLDKPLID